MFCFVVICQSNSVRNRFDSMNFNGEMIIHFDQSHSDVLNHVDSAHFKLETNKNKKYKMQNAISFKNNNNNNDSIQQFQFEFPSKRNTNLVFDSIYF